MRTSAAETWTRLSACGACSPPASWARAAGASTSETASAIVAARAARAFIASSPSPPAPHARRAAPRTPRHPWSAVGRRSPRTRTPWPCRSSARAARRTARALRAASGSPRPPGAGERVLHPHRDRSVAGRALEEAAVLLVPEARVLRLGQRHRALEPPWVERGLVEVEEPERGVGVVVELARALRLALAPAA